MEKTSLTTRDLSILVGNILDHFDTSLYGFLAPILAPLFFPNEDQIVGLILAYSIFAASIIMRPVGSYFFGLIAKIHGATLALSYSLIGLAVTTILIGLIPTHAVIGWISPLMLIIIRALQAIFAEGETTIAKLYLVENKIHSQAIKASYLYEASTMLGILIASFVSTIVISSNHHECWRICFIFGGITGFIGYFLRRYSIFQDRKKIKKKLEHYDLFGLVSIWSHKSSILHLAIIHGFYYLTYSIAFVLMNSFVPLITSVSLEIMMFYNTILLILDMAMVPLIGSLIAKYNPKKILIAAPTLLGLTILPLWWNLDNGSLCYITVVRLWIVILGVMFACPLNFWLNSLFNSTDKYMLVGIANALGSSVIGRLTPAICLLLWHSISMSLSIGLYIAMIALATIYAIKMLRVKF